MELDRIDDLTALSIRLECGVSLLYVLYDFMKRDMYATSTLAPAIYAVHEYLSDIAEKLQELNNDFQATK